ncbi:MAG: flagellin lysine-N-methylase [Selenomonadaceae bacterium]|nr:flagellin lysine-N-methylase [Selenomonadaceae bacterium]
MAKQFLYFQPEYVGKFKCDGSKCNARCCKNWIIGIDAATYEKYSRIKPKNIAKEITSRMKFNSEREEYIVTLEENFCPFLNENNLCRLQLDYGEEILSVTCTTYPRRTYSLGNFFERSLSLTCPVAAEMILFNQEPMKFELVEVPDKIHSKHGRIGITPVPISKDDAPLVREIQIAMISILQERQFTIDQRLIVLGLFLDKLQELISGGTDGDNVLDLIAAYRSEEFLLTEMPPILQSFAFDANKFVTFMIKFISHTWEALRSKEGLKFFAAFEKVFGIKPDENDIVFIPEIAANFEKLVDARKNFSENYSTFLENYLVNELFYSFYPWRFRDQSLTKNFIVFLISCKIFEMMTFAAIQGGLDSKEDLSAMVNWFMLKTDHNDELYKRFFELLEGVDDTYLLMVTLL